MTVDFKKLLAKPLDDVKRPPAAPAGTYFGVISKFTFQESRFADKDTNEKHGQVKFDLAQVRPGEDVDVAGLEGIDLAKRPLAAELPLEGGNEYITKSLLEKLGIATLGRGFGETIPEAVGKEVMFTLTQRMDKNNPENIYNDVRNLRAPVQPVA